MPPLMITRCMCDSSRVWHIDWDEDEMLPFLLGNVIIYAPDGFHVIALVPD